MLNFGSFGVMLFFIVSGFIIPASLERRGSLVEFWIGRFFRLVPLFWLLSATVVLLWSLDLLSLPFWIFNYPWVVLFGNATLMTNFVGSPHLLAPAWTLPYEICFYALTSAIFVTKLRKASAAIALFLAGFALFAADTFLTDSALTPQAASDPGHVGNPVRVLVLAAMAAAVIALLAINRRMAIYAGVVGFIAVMLFLNRSWPLHQAVVFLSLMFTGTVIFRAASGQIPVKLAWITVPLVAVCDTIAFWLYFEPWGAESGAFLGGAWWTESVAALTAIVVFLVAHALRDRIRWARSLQWLGRISYSVYLVHWVVMMSVPALPAQIPAHGLLTMLMWLAITLGVSQLTYAFVERPAVDLGRRVALWARHRYQLSPVTVVRPRAQEAQPAAPELV
jgi:peptidoglycan/LPS O-acetylase OafA/YrhL